MQVRDLISALRKCDWRAEVTISCVDEVDGNADHDVPCEIDTVTSNGGLRVRIEPSAKLYHEDFVGYQKKKIEELEKKIATGVQAVKDELNKIEEVRVKIDEAMQELDVE